MKMFKQKLGDVAGIYQKFVHLGENNFLRFSPTTVVHVNVFSLKNYLACLPVLQTESHQEVK